MQGLASVRGIFCVPQFVSVRGIFCMPSLASVYAACLDLLQHPSLRCAPAVCFPSLVSPYTAQQQCEPGIPLSTLQPRCMLAFPHEPAMSPFVHLRHRNRVLPGSAAGLQGCEVHKIQIGYAAWLGKRCGKALSLNTAHTCASCFAGTELGTDLQPECASLCMGLSARQLTKS